MSKKQEVKKKLVIGEKVVDHENEETKPINESTSAGTGDGGQDSQGVLNVSPPADRFRVTARSIESIPIENLQDITEIADYKDATEASMPLVTRTPIGDYLEDGKDLVNRARAAGETSIFCEVDTVAEHNLLNLCLGKAGARSKTRGGRARYAELVRNAYKLETQILQANPDLKIFAHGGRRIGENFLGDSANDVRIVLAERLSKSKNTINTYISHAKYISDHIMSLLIQNDRDKKFFEKFGHLKTKLVERLQEQSKTSDEITTEVSTLMLQFIDGAVPAPIPIQPQSQPTQSIPQENPPENEEDIEKEPIGGPTPPAAEPSENPIARFKRSTIEVSARLSQRIETVNDPTILYNAVIEEIQALSAIALQIKGLTNPESQQEQKAA
jgi:hypothetical protein